MMSHQQNILQEDLLEVWRQIKVTESRSALYGIQLFSLKLHDAGLLNKLIVQE